MIRLAPTLNMDAAAALAAELRNVAPAAIDASEVRQLGFAALQVLLSARAAGFSLSQPSDALCRAAHEAGAADLLGVPPIVE